MMNRLSSLGASFERLSGREQVTALLLVILLSTLFVGSGGYFVSKDLSRREARINAKLKNLKKLAGLRSDYQRRLSEQRQLAAKIRQNNRTRLLSYIEKVSKEASTPIKNAAERAGQPTGSELLREVAAEVTVENVSIDRLYDFLDRLEKGNKMVKVRKLEVKARFDNQKMLNAKVTVGTFKTSES